MDVLVNASVAEGNLVSHTESVDNIIVLIAEEHARLNRLLRRRSVVLTLVVHWLIGVHLVHWVGGMVHVGLLLARSIGLPIITCLVDILTHLIV